jgi:short-chain fatty acids transporter
MVSWLVMKVAANGFGPTISNLNNYLFIVLTLAFLLHWRIRNFLRAISQAVPAVGAVLIQFPIYAAVAAVLMTAHNDAGMTVAKHLGDLFASVVSKNFLPPVVGLYSIAVGLFIPSAGAKWVVEAPYILQAGNEVHSHLGWLVNTYSGMEMLANLLNPFWMLPMMGILGLRARNVVGFTFVYFIFLLPTMIVAFWLLGCTLDYHVPVIP